MKKSKKLLAFLLSSFMVCAVPAFVTGCDGCNNDDPPAVEQPTEPSKVKDGINLSVKKDESTTVKVSDYITSNGKTVTVETTNPDVASAQLKDGVVTVTGNAKGTAIVKLICENIVVSFNVTVTAEEIKTPAPVFEDVSENLDLKLNSSVEVTLAPASGGDNFTVTYALANSLSSGAEIEDGKLKFTPAETGKYEIGIVADCTEKNNAQNVYSVTFKVIITVTESQETVYFKVTVDGAETQVEEGETFTLPAYTGNVPEGKEFKCWKIGEEEKNAGDEITVTGDVTVTSVFKNKVYTVTIDGVAQTVEHGEKITLPSYDKTVEEGKQFSGWTDGTDTMSAGSHITVTGNLTITAVIENLPETPPELVKASDTVALTVETDATKTLSISEYITTNGYAVNFENSAPETVDVELTSTEITLTAIASGNAEVTITCGNLTVTITVNVINPPASVKQTEVIDSEIHDLFGEELVLNLSANIKYSEQITGYKVDGIDVQGSTYTVTGTYTDIAEEVTFTVTAMLEDGSDIEYTYKVTVKDTSVCRVQNGSFDNGLDGWTFSDSENPIGEISQNETFWEELPMFNEGNYFRGESKEGNTGTLTSSAFKVGGIEKISFMLGAGNGCFVTLEKEDGTVLAVWRNVKFEDIGDGWNADKIGTEQFALNLVTYVADLSEWSGETVRLVINDEATSGIGFVTFDELVTYYASESDLPQGAQVAVNELADTSALAAKIEEVSSIEQGDCTTESFASLTSAIDMANAIVNKKGVTAQQLTLAMEAIETARDGLTLRTPEEKDVSKILALKSGAETTVDPAKFVDTKDLSSITFELSSDSAKLTISGMNITAQTVIEDTDEIVTLTVKYKGEIKLEVELTVKLTSVDKPVVNQSEVTNEIDIYSQRDKEKIILDFADNVENPANLTLTYTVTMGDSADALVLDEGNRYEYAFDGNYNDTATEVVFNVVVGSEENALTVSYTYTLMIKDTTAYRVANGSFQSGDLTGWTLVSGEAFGAVSNDDKYFTGEEYGKDANDDYLFTGVAGDVHGENGEWEAKKGVLRSETFILKQNGWISFLMGGAHNVNTGVRVKTADGLILAEFNNDGKGQNAVMDRYIYKFTGMQADTLCYIEIFDNAETGWGCIAVDDFNTYFGDSTPEGIEIAPYYVKGQIYNAGFEKGDLSGWTILTEGMTGGVINDNTFWNERLPFNNNGYFLSGFNTGIEEAYSWAVRSTNFTLTGTGYISVRMGGNAAAVKVFKADGTPVGTYRATHFSDTNYPYEGDGDDKGSWACMRTYFIDLSGYIGEELYIELHDLGGNESVPEQWPWAQAFFDEVVTHYETVPDYENGFDTVIAPVGKTTVPDGEGQEVEVYVYEEVRLAWRLALKEVEED